MVPSISTAPAAAFFDAHEHPSYNAEAAVYYGGREVHTRARTYSNVSRVSHPSTFRFLICIYRPVYKDITNDEMGLTTLSCVLEGFLMVSRIQSTTHPSYSDCLPDEKPIAPRRFLIDVDETIRVILEQEDTNGDFQVSHSSYAEYQGLDRAISYQISVTDAGPKFMSLGTATSNGYKSFDIRVRCLDWLGLFMH